MKRVPALASLTLALLSSVSASAQNRVSPVRPRILGVARIDLRTDDLAAARKFYAGVLGLETIDESAAAAVATFKINDHQYVDVTPNLTGPKQDRLIRTAFETSDAEQLRSYLASQGIKVPDHASNADGNVSFELTDPDGHQVQFIQYMPGSLAGRNFGKHLPATRVSDRMIHVGFVVNDRVAEDHFYGDILGFHSIWHGGMKDDQTDWVDMRVPDGTDWLEYMLNVHNPDPKTLGVMHHFALGVPSVAKGFETITARGYQGEKPQIGRDGKWQLNLYDPNYTRVELMEPKPVQKPCCSPMLD
jgi:catechol 2,3-dioxygenase-like lactoylglutathione lyase family enzyme